MKTKCIFFASMILMIMASSASFAQVSNINSFIINVNSPDIVQYGDLFTVKNPPSGVPGEGYTQFNQNGVLTTNMIPLNPGSGSGFPGSDVVSISGNFAVAKINWDFTHGYTYGLFYTNPNTGVMKRIRTTRQVRMYAYQVNNNLVAVDFVHAPAGSPAIGSTLVGDTYGGDLGATGSDIINLAPLGPFDHGLMFLDSTGALVKDIPTLTYTQAVEIRGVQEFSSSYALKMQVKVSIDEGADSIFFVLLDKNNPALPGTNTPNIIAQTNTVHSVSQAAHISEEASSGDFVVSIKPTSGPGFIQRFSSSFSELANNNPYQLITGNSGGSPLFVSDQLVVPGLSAGYIFGKENLDARYSFNRGLSGYNARIISIDFPTMIATIMGYYTTTGNVLSGVPLADPGSGQIGVFFGTIDLNESGERFNLSTANSNVLGAFAYHARSGSNPNQMDSTDQHIGYLQVATMPTPGATVPADIYQAPNTSWSIPYPPVYELDSLTNEVYFVLRAVETTSYAEVQVLRVICTTDPLFVPTVNTPPVILGLVSGVLDCGTVISGDNHEVVVNYSDAEGDLCTAFLAADSDLGVSLVNNPSSTNFSLIFGELPQGDLNLVMYLTDGTDTVSATAHVMVDGSVNIAEISESDFRVYPNPATDVLNIKTPIAGIMMNIHSMNGRLMLSEYISSEMYQVSLDAFENGMYTISFTGGNTYHMKKFIKR